MTASETLRPGRTLGGFVLGDKLAVGGMAEIWAAHRAAEGPAAKVALKVLLPHFSAEPTFLAMFRDEVAIASRLRHQNIVSVFGVHEADGLLFQAMERIDGFDLRRLLSHLARSGRRLPVPLALFIGQQLARALDYAHQRRGDDGRALDIVHRDVSPHNVMLSSDGQVKLLDFGVARAAERTARTRTGVIKGKLAYMAPEQALAVGVTPQTDIFAAGIVLWEMLAQERLFTASSDAALVDTVVRADVPPIEDKNPDVPPEVAALLSKMLQARALERPAGMGEVERGLTKALVVHYDEADAGERVLAAWLKRFGPVARPPTAVAPADDDTAPTPAPAAAEPATGDPTLTFAAPDDAVDRTWPGPAPAPPDVDVGAVTAALPSLDPRRDSNGDPTPVDPGPGPRDALEAPPAPAEPRELDLARTLIDDSFDPRSVLGEAPTPEAEAKFRRPTDAEINSAVDAQSTVEVVADPELRRFAQQLEVSALPTPSATSAPWAVVAPPGPRPGAPWQAGADSEPRTDLDPEPSPERPDVPTLAGDLVDADTVTPGDGGFEPETLRPAPPLARPPPRSPEAPRVALRGTDSSGGFEPVGRRPDPAERARPLTPVPAPPTLAEPRSKWSWVLPALTLLLAGVVVVLIFLLIRGQ